MADQKKSSTERSDYELTIAIFENKSYGALKELMRRHRVFYINKLNDNLFEEIFTKTIRTVYKEIKYGNVDESYTKAFYKKVYWNLSISLYKKQHRTISIEKILQFTFKETDLLGGSEVVVKVEKFIEDLDIVHVKKEILKLRFLENMKPRFIAKLLDLRGDYVRKTIERKGKSVKMFVENYYNL